MSIRALDISAVPVDHPVAVFHRFWREAARGNTWAPWSAFDPSQHPAILPWVLLLKRESSSADASWAWRYAVCGTGCTALFGFSYQGKLFGQDLPPDAAAQRRAEFDRATSGEGPQFSHAELPIPDRDFVAVYRGVFPFAAGTDGVDRLFIVIARDDARV